MQCISGVWGVGFGVWGLGCGKGGAGVWVCFRAQIVALAESGRSIADLAREFEPSRWTINHWVKQARVDAEGPTPSGPMTTDERAELRRLRRENQTLKTEREILAKATALWR
ncbi:hypothetical protein CRI94_14625 [Longibacter salinarum]|uniref:Transposase n=1 Tax=Longibacter salinarum TaxID=1850348 RepID=A0A2A8CUZ1_9BACT|nr:transposase [Longibacter salinarum]PEN12268.1 hypothetical protein CRI94_14625 [Longibacter salinarum]